LAISPRLAKIMINLSEIKNGKLLDAFCGVGTILQEALLQGVEIVGLDLDRRALEGAKKNLEWFGFEKNKYFLFVGDSKKADVSRVEVLVSEPDLGEIHKKIPQKEKAEKQLKDFEKLMVQVLNNFKKRINGKVVFTSPYIRIGKKRIACDVENICERTGYKKSYDGIPEFREEQIVGRMIFVLEKE
jgi:tRNA G10  N-methylase Trm11